MSPNKNVWNNYSFSPSDFDRDYIELDVEKLDFAIEDLQVCLKKLKKTRKLSAPQLASAK